MLKRASSALRPAPRVRANDVYDVRAPSGCAADVHSYRAGPAFTADSGVNIAVWRVERRGVTGMVGVVLCC
jgi:hypothetical protein